MSVKSEFCKHDRILDFSLIFAYRGIIIPLLCSYRGGSQGLSPTYERARVGLALDTLIIFTDVLEKFSMLISSILFAVMVIMFGWIVYSIFSTVRPVEGWMSLMTLISFGFFMMSVMLTLIFKYLSVILNMSFKRQRYVIEGVEKLTK